MTEHPMDQIPVRQLRFDYSELENANPLWSRSSPNFSRFINALGLHVPYFERFLVDTMRAYRDGLDDEDLKSDVQAIIGQEAHHAFNFVKWNQVLTAYYPGLEKIEVSARKAFEKQRLKDKKFKIGFTAGYETFTFLGGMIILDRYEELMGDADPVLRALWVWHQVEEVEHGSVAFDFYKAFYGGSEWYRRGMILSAFGHIAWQTFLAYRIMLQGESGKDKMKAWRFFGGFAWDLFYASIPVHRRGYRPRDHPICLHQQNPVAVSWRRFHQAGKDVQILTDDSMEQILVNN